MIVKITNSQEHEPKLTESYFLNCTRTIKVSKYRSSVNINCTINLIKNINCR